MPGPLEAQLTSRYKQVSARLGITRSVRDTIAEKRAEFHASAPGTEFVDSSPPVQRLCVEEELRELVERGAQRQREAFEEREAKKAAKLKEAPRSKASA